MAAKPTSEFETVALEHIDSVLRGAMALCGNEADAADLVQTTYVKALENFGSFRPGTNMKAWLLRILRNTYLDQVRRNKVVRFTAMTEQVQPAAPPEDEHHLAADWLENFSDKQVIEALATLPEDQRLALYLADVEQMDQDEIARLMDVAVGTIKSRTSRARAVLREKLAAHARDLGFVGRMRDARKR